LQADREVVLAAVKKNHVPLLYAGDALKQDEQFITELVKIVNKNPVAFRSSFKSSWLTDKEFMLKLTQPKPASPSSSPKPKESAPQKWFGTQK
jgi:hypothetical protein